MELILIGLMAGLGYASIALWARGRATEEKERQRLASGKEAERTPATLQVGDVVQHFGRDWLAEGVLTLSEEGRGSRLARLADGAVERFLYLPGGETDPWFLEAVALELPGTSPPDPLEHQGRRYRQRALGRALVARVGAVTRGVGDRVEHYLYQGPGTEVLLLLVWPETVEGFAGERVQPGSLDILPGR